MAKKLTLADFPDEPGLNSTDLALRQIQADAKEKASAASKESTSKP